ncbi:MAG: Maf family protein [Thermaurantiacus sp.]
MIILASASASRRAMLEAAGVMFETVPARIDEEAVTAGLRAERADGRTLADRLAELKALKVSAACPGRIVLGADSVAEMEDGSLLEKPGTRAGLQAQLRRMSGTRHRLISAAVAVRDGAPLWRHAGVALMDVRALSEPFIAAHAEAVDAGVLGSVGGYHVEGLGVQIFAAIRGDHFTVRGLPLLPLLAWLRAVGELPA